MVGNPFEKAIDVLRERGWHQGDFESSHDGSVCAVGALGVACVGNASWLAENQGDWTPVMKTLRTVLQPDDPSTFFIPDWNDDPERTVEDVILALKMAAVEWDGIGGPVEGGSDVRD